MRGATPCETVNLRLASHLTPSSLNSLETPASAQSEQESLPRYGLRPGRCLSPSPPRAMHRERCARNRWRIQTLPSDCRLRPLQDHRKDRRVELTENLRRLASNVHAQPRLQVNNDVERALYRRPPPVLIAPLNGRNRCIKKTNNPVIESHHKIHRRRPVQCMFTITSHLVQTPSNSKKARLP